MKSEGVTYRLSFKNRPEWAIGSTTKKLHQRKSCYLYDANHGHCNTRLYELIREVGKDGFDLTEVDKIYFSDRSKLLNAEKALIFEHRDDFGDKNCLNTLSPITTAEEKQAYNQQNAKENYIKNAEARKAYSQRWRESNPDKVIAYHQKWWMEHKDNVNMTRRQNTANKDTTTN